MQVKVSGTFENADIAELCAAKIKNAVPGITRIAISREKERTGGSISSFMLSNSSINYMPFPIFEESDRQIRVFGAVVNIYCSKSSRRLAEQQILSLGGSLHGA